MFPLRVWLCCFEELTGFTSASGLLRVSWLLTVSNRGKNLLSSFNLQERSTRFTCTKNVDVRGCKEFVERLIWREISFPTPDFVAQRLSQSVLLCPAKHSWWSWNHDPTRRAAAKFHPNREPQTRHNSRGSTCAPQQSSWLLKHRKINWHLQCHNWSSVKHDLILLRKKASESKLSSSKAKVTTLFCYHREAEWVRMTEWCSAQSEQVEEIQADAY